MNNFVNIASLIYGKWSYGGSGQFTVQFGPLHWLALIFSPLVFHKSKKDNQTKGLLLILWFFITIAVFLMLPLSNVIWSKILLLQNFQFPWRFLAIVVFVTSVLGALLVDALPKKINRIYFVTFAIIVILKFRQTYNQKKVRALIQIKKCFPISFFLSG